MRKAFAFLTSSLSSINKFSSEETEASSTDIQKENNKSQTTISNTKNEKLSQNKHNNTNENPTKINNNNINSLNKIKKNNSNDFKKLDSKKSVPQLKKQSLRRKTSSRTTSSTTVTTPRSSSNKLSVIKSSDNESETKGDDEEEEKDDDDVPLGLCLKRSQSVSSNYPPPFSQRNQVYYDDDTRIRNVSLHHNHSTTQDQNMGRYHYHYSPRHLSQRSLPVPTTPPLIHTSYQPKLHYFGERRFSSSASSSSSASADSSGSRYYRNSNNNKNNRCSTYSLPYWNEYEYDDYIHDRHRYYDIELFDDYDEHLPPPIERMRRDSLNNSSPCSRNNSFSTSRSTARRSNDSNCLVAGANPPSPNKYQKEATKKMSTAEYHRYQQEMVAAQYLKHGMNPVIDESIPINSELLNNTPRTLMQVQTLMVGTVNAPSTRPKRFSVIDRGYSGYSSSGSNTPPLTGLARRTSYTRTTSDYGGGVGNGGGNEINDLSYHRRIHSESTVLQQQISPRYSTRHHHHNTSLHLQQQFHHSATSLSSGSTYVSSSGSGGPPTPTSRKSSMMFGSNVR